MIVALCTVLALLAVPSHEQDSHGSTLTSPCPNVFMYDPPGSEPGLWSGVVTLSTDILLHSTWLNVVLDSHAAKLGNWLGNVTTLDGLDFVIDNEEMQIHPGQPVLVPFYIQYDPLNTIPRLRAIRLNGKAICNAVTQQRDIVGRPVVSGPEIRTNLDIKQVQTPPRKPDNPVYRRPVNNNSSAAPAFNPVQRIPNTRTTTADCGLVESPLTLSGHYEMGEVPWLVAIYRIYEKSLRFICGGTLVSDRHVVTAAHCMYRIQNEIPIEDIVVKAGVHELDAWSDDAAIITKPIAADKHESYDTSTLENDIMVLTLDKRVNFTNFIRPACLWSGNTDLSQIVGSTGVVAGWGGTNEHKALLLDEPRMLRVTIVSTKDCRASKPIFYEITSDKTLCAGSGNGDGPCAGDGGGGLYLKEGGKWRLRGVVSISIKNDKDTSKVCDFNEYVVYTDTAQYLPWIRSILSTKYFD